MHVVLADVEPFRVLVEHRIDDVDEGFVRREKAVTTREQIPFEPAFKGVLGEHFEHASVGRELAAVGVFGEVIG